MPRYPWFCNIGFAAAIAAPFGCGGDEATTSSEGTPAGSGGGVVVACPEGFADCDGELSNGCEATLETSPLNCGACGVACASVHQDALCSAGTCIALCQAGFADCDGDASNGCEVDTANDPAHCGACARSCSASCAYATCDITVLASAQETPTLLALDDDAVYWSSQGSPPAATGSVNRVPRGGGEVTVIASNQAIALGVAVDATSIYWVTLGLTPGSGTVMMAPKQGGPAITLAEGQASPFRVARDGDWLYWTNRGDPPNFQDGGVKRISVVDPNASPEELVVVPGSPSSLCVGQDAVFFTVLGSGDMADGSLRALPKNGGPVTVLADGLVSPGALLCLQTNVYFRTWTSILSIPVAGGAPTTIVGDMTEPAIRLASDGASLYWPTASSASPSVEAAALDGSSRRTIASAQTGLIDVAVDDASVYWTRFATTSEPVSGVVLKAAK